MKTTRNNLLYLQFFFFQKSSLLFGTILLATLCSSALGMENVVYTTNGAVCGQCSSDTSTQYGAVGGAQYKSLQHRTINPPSLSISPPYLLAQSRVVNTQHAPSGEHKITTTTYYTDYATGNGAQASDIGVTSGTAGTSTFDSKYTSTYY